MPFELLPHAFFTLSDGNRLRYARFEPVAAPRGTVLIVPGRREFIEKKFFELGKPLLDRGYRIIIVELRGMGLSSRFLTGNQHQRDHIVDFTTSLGDLRAFFSEIVQSDVTGPLFVHGHSLGGHYLLRWLSEDRPAVTGAFLTAPMLALAGVPVHLTAHGISWVGVRLFGHATDYAPMQHDYGSEDKSFHSNPLTHDADRFPIIENYFAAHPEMTVGGVTWGWILAALRSMNITHAQHYLARIDIPVLALAGADDRVTPAPEIARYLNYIPRMRSHVIQDSRHDVMNETANVRTEAWQRISEFLTEFTPE
jgi:lysophospholipase